MVRGEHVSLVFAGEAAYRLKIMPEDHAETGWTQEK